MEIRPDEGACEGGRSEKEGVRGKACGGETRVLTGFVERLAGLKSKSFEAKAACAVLVPCRDVHTFGMRFPIDVAFVDASGTAVEVYRCVAPRCRIRCRRARLRRAVDRGGAEGVFRHAARAAPGRMRRGGARGGAKMKAKTRMEKDEEDERGMR